LRTVFCCPLDPPLPSRPSRARLIFVGEVVGTRTGDRVRFAWRIFDLPHDNHQSDLRDARDKGDYCHSPRRPALLKRMRIVNTSCETLGRVETLSAPINHSAQLSRGTPRPQHILRKTRRRLLQHPSCPIRRGGLSLAGPKAAAAMRQKLRV
jgi:hypothetical protein